MPRETEGTVAEVTAKGIWAPPSCNLRVPSGPAWAQSRTYHFYPDDEVLLGTPNFMA